MKKKKAGILAAVLLFCMILSALPASADVSSAGDIYSTVRKSLEKQYTIVFEGTMDLDHDGTVEYLAVVTDGIARPYDGGAFRSQYQLAVYGVGDSGKATKIGMLRGLFTDGTVGGMQSLSVVTIGGQTCIVHGGTDMNYRYHFYSVSNGKLRKCATFLCEWSEDVCYVDGQETNRSEFLAQLREVLSTMRTIQYFGTEPQAETAA